MNFLLGAFDFARIQDNLSFQFLHWPERLHQRANGAACLQANVRRFRSLGALAGEHILARTRGDTAYAASVGEFKRLNAWNIPYNYFQAW